MILADAPLGDEVAEITDEQSAALLLERETTAAYLKAAQQLLGGRLSHLREFAPPYLLNPGNAIAVCCPDGIAIRYEPRSGEKRGVGAAWIPRPLAEVVAILSQNLIWLRSRPEDAWPSDEFGIQLSFSMRAADGTERGALSAGRISFVADLNQAQLSTVPSMRPPRLFSVRNTLVLEIHGETVDAVNGRPEHPFILQSPLRLPVG